MLISNLNFEEITTKEKSIKNKNNLREKLLSDQQEQINIQDYNFSQLIELLPANFSFSSQQVINQLLDQQLTDQQLQSILKTIVRWDNLKDVDLSALYKQLFQQQICISTLSDGLVYCKEDLTLIINQLIEVYQTLIIEDPSKLQNISSWIHTILSNNKLTIPKKEISKLLGLIKQNQKYQEAIRNIKILINQTPQEQKSTSRITHLFF